MISMAFLPKLVGGNEFIDFQTTRFYDLLSTLLANHIVQQDGKNILKESARKDILTAIEQFTGFNNITIKFEDAGNLAVDTGFFSPKNVLNNEGIDAYLNITKTTLYRWYRENKSKVFKGDIDYSTGKVSGSFKTVPVNLYINQYLDVTFPPEKVAKFGEPLAGLLCGAIAHEMGHVFGGCMMIHTQASDNLAAKAALAYYRGAARPEDRVVILRETAAILEEEPAKVAELQAIANDPKDEAFILYFNKLVAQRNTRRSLSVGVEKMSSEVIADMYAIRMGCHKGIVAAIATLVDVGLITATCNSLLTAALLTVLTELLLTPLLLTILTTTGGLGPFMFFSGVIFTSMFVLDFFSRGYSGTYNADHRRFDDAMRQLIAKVKQDPRINMQERNQLVSEIENLLQINKALKPWYDNTVLYRMMGWVYSGTDFKLSEVEHYTQVLANHELNLLSTKLAALKARRDPDNIEGRETDKTFEA